MENDTHAHVMKKVEAAISSLDSACSAIQKDFDVDLEYCQVLRKVIRKAQKKLRKALDKIR